MKWLDALERRFRHLAIENITLYLVFFQAFCFLAAMARPDFFGKIVLVPGQVAQGEWWRLFTFLVTPPATNPLFAFFALWFFYFMGTSLESHWGAFRYNLYLLVNYLAAIIGALLCMKLDPTGIATNLYIDGSLLIAFAYLWPDYPIRLYFLIPVRIKWFALATWIGYLVTLGIGHTLDRILVVACILNFLLFFGKDIVFRTRSGHMFFRGIAKKQAEAAEAAKPAFHTCAACGITDRTNPRMEFRYCPDCAGSPGYCIDHIFAHEHKK